MFVDRLKKTACVNEELILIDTRLAVLKYGVMENQAIINLYIPTSYQGIRMKLWSGNNLPITGNLEDTQIIERALHCMGTTKNEEIVLWWTSCAKVTKDL